MTGLRVATVSAASPCGSGAPPRRTSMLSPHESWRAACSIPDAMASDESKGVRKCPRCGGQTMYWPDAIVPGDPVAPRGSRRAVAHHQPAWLCVSCGHLEAEERRV